jgi:hypothetical protein
MDIDNDMALEAVLMGELKEVIAECSEEALEIIRKNVQEYVYDWWESEVRQYERLGEYGGYLGSWTKERLMEGIDEGLSEIGRSIAYSIFSDPNRMISEYPHHKSIDGEDRRSIMTEAILNGIEWDWSRKDGSYEWWKNKGSRDFWTPSLEEISNKFINSFLSKLRSRLGMDIL